MCASTFEFFALGSDCVLRLFAENDAEAQRAASAAMDEIARIEARYSRYRPDSELSRINLIAEGRWKSLTIDPETAGLHRLCLRRLFAKQRRRLFDVTSGLLRRAWDFS